MNSLSIEQSIFANAIEIASPEERAKYLDDACRNDTSLRAEIESLIEAHDKLKARNHASPTPTDNSIQLDLFGDSEIRSGYETIGPYKLLEPIGEGGMGTVWMAEQTDPVRRRVALKLIKPGMDSKQVIARFEAERQALAMMDHPNIARIHDGGVTSDGRPYFVMELVRGLPITEYCDRQQLSIDDRLDLFVLVCRAVQHAHQKGVIHRDLKPSNVLVTVIDGVGVPKVIDFGIAKATGQSLTDKTLFTGFHQFVGTPLYVSPEQAALAGVDVDTRSDIYSLGVLLYELLTGTTPFDGETLKQAAFDEMRRIIREDEPPRPSVRISSLGDTRTTVAENRRAEPKRLSSTLKGELDWIVMKALEKDRNRRYESSAEFANDVVRYRMDQPVSACPPSRRYRFAKFARRNRVALTAGTLIAASLVTGTALSTWQARRARVAERATSQALEAVKEALSKAEEQTQVAQNAVDSMYTQFAEKWMDQQAGIEPIQREFLLKALDYYLKTTADNSDDFGSRRKLGLAYRRIGRIQSTLGQHAEAAEAYRHAIAIHMDIASRLVSAAEPLSYIAVHEQAHDELSMSMPLKALGKSDESEAMVRKALERFTALGNRFPDSSEYVIDQARCHNSLAEFFRSAGRLQDSLEPANQAVILMRRLNKENPTSHVVRKDFANNLNSLGVLQNELGRLTEAESTLREAAAVQEDLLRHDNVTPEALSDQGGTLNNLAMIIYQKGDKAEAIRLIERAATLQQDALRLNPRLEDARRYLKNHMMNLVIYGKETANHAVASRWAEERYRTFTADWRDAAEPADALVDCAKIARADAALEATARQNVVAGYLNKAHKMMEAASRRAPDDADAQDGIAWFFVTTDEAVLRDHELTLRLVRRAIELAPEKPHFQVTLGGALTLAGQWAEAIEVLNRVNTQASGPDPGALLWQSMSLQHIGKPKEARDCLDRAVSWIEQNDPDDQLLRRLRSEAQALLGPKTTPNGPSPNSSSKPASKSDTNPPKGVVP